MLVNFTLVCLFYSEVLNEAEIKKPEAEAKRLKLK